LDARFLRRFLSFDHSGQDFRVARE
jgi:hypothetical protein